MSAAGFKDDAAKHFQMAELQVHYVEILNIRLAPHEKDIKEVNLPDRKGRPVRDPIEQLVFNAKNKQRSYEAQRAAWKIPNNIKYGHLAKAEKQEAE
jgi:hypothetical protein